MLSPPSEHIAVTLECRGYRAQCSFQSIAIQYEYLNFNINRHRPRAAVKHGGMRLTHRTGWKISRSAVLVLCTESNSGDHERTRDVQRHACPHGAQIVLRCAKRRTGELHHGVHWRVSRKSGHSARQKTPISLCSGVFECAGKRVEYSVRATILARDCDIVDLMEILIGVDGATGPSRPSVGRSAPADIRYAGP